MNTREVIAAVQKRLVGLGHNIGIDGVAGPQTWGAIYSELHGNEVEVVPVKPEWPEDTDSALRAFYGPPGESNLVRINFPYPMRIAWDTGVVVHHSRCHRLVHDSLLNILREILNHYGSLDAVRNVGMDLFGGIYNYRKKTGGSSWSRHAWGIAIDLDPDRNGWKVPRPPATMPESVVKIFEDEGWKSGGRAWGHDWMHFQCTR